MRLVTEDRVVDAFHVGVAVDGGGGAAVGAAAVGAGCVAEGERVLRGGVERIGDRREQEQGAGCVGAGSVVASRHSALARAYAVGHSGTRGVCPYTHSPGRWVGIPHG